MAKEIKISLSDDEFGVLQDAYAKDENDKEKDDIDVAYVKGRLMNMLKAKVRNYDEWKQSVSYSSFDPS
jgi:vacuolar-type H+-ATPase subunit F/Vma7|tara:strand:+ start:194 stop:400 length:207 start_codon:yes stop_codon:yes gene_type:complete